jgi:hypothetical protein
MLPWTAIVIFGVIYGSFHGSPGGAVVLGIVFLLVFNGVAILQSVRDWIRLTPSELIVQRPLARATRTPRDKIKRLRVSRRRVEFVGIDELSFATVERGPYRDSQLVEIASALGIPVQGPRRPRRLGRFEDA